MKTITLSAHFDGEQIRLDEPHELAPNTPLLVTVLPSDAFDEERADWIRLSMESLNRAYGEDEPEYSVEDILEANDPLEPFIGGLPSQIPDWADRHDEHLGRSVAARMRRRREEDGLDG